MTNITGKIYQMKNADGTENRFPRTVIEAVLGLSSYLQDQFSSLADIYMPIEGIYEALTGQEFVFRKSPNTIKAKSLTIDRIKGKTIVVDNQLASNDAEAVETTGVNQWDEELLHGYTVDSASGKVVEAPSDMCPKNFISVIPGTAYYINIPVKYTPYINLRLYGQQKEYLRATSAAPNAIYTIQNDVYYIKFNIRNLEYTYDICINISDPAINGQYFPYWKRTLNLGLNSFKVKDGQGNITTITGGLKSAGSVYDEIVGNKYIKRIGSVDLGSATWTARGGGVFNTTIPGLSYNGVCAKYAILYNGTPSSAGDKTLSMVSYYDSGGIYIKDSAFDGYTGAQVAEALSGVMLYYELSTPIEYDLVEPLIYTTKAGTTEERISPNSDGLSAPFCCDMTYSANENNDAGNAQYAATAGRLLNTRKIWGQDFNGSEDVNGALTGVTNISMNGALSGLTNINSLINIASGNVGIGTVSPEHKLDVAGTLRATGLVTLGGGLTIPNTADAKHGTLDFIDGDRVKHIVVVNSEEEIPASPDLYTLYVVATTTV